MPIYEFKCKSCAMTFDRLMRISEENTPLCPQCGGETKKLISSAGLLFKGDGFYITDYSRKNKKGQEGGQTPEKPAAAKDPGKKSTDSPSAAKSSSSKDK